MEADIYQSQGRQTLSRKGQIANIFGCVDHPVCTQLSHFSTRAATGNMQMKEHSGVLIKFNFQKQVEGWIWPPGCTGLLGSGYHGLQPCPVQQ